MHRLTRLTGYRRWGLWSFDNQNPQLVMGDGKPISYNMLNHPMLTPSLHFFIRDLEARLMIVFRKLPACKQ